MFGISKRIDYRTKMLLNIGLEKYHHLAFGDFKYCLLIEAGNRLFYQFCPYCEMLVDCFDTLT